MSDSGPTLWQIDVSHFSEKARWALAYKGVEHRRRSAPPGLHMLVALWLSRDAGRAEDHGGDGPTRRRAGGERRRVPGRGRLQRRRPHGGGALLPAGPAGRGAATRGFAYSPRPRALPRGAQRPSRVPLGERDVPPSPGTGSVRHAGRKPLIRSCKKFTFADNTLHPVPYAASIERMAWTDERLQERFNGIDHRFDEVDKRFDAVDRKFDAVDRKFDAVDRRFDRVEGEIVELRRGMGAGFGAPQSLLNRAGAGIIVSLMGVIVAVLLRGV